VTGVSADTATITYTVSGTGGCANATATRTITVRPFAGTLSGNQAICVGSTSAFTSNGTAGGSWSSNNVAVATVNATTGVVTGVSAGTATITYTVSGTGGCPNATATRTVTVTQGVSISVQPDTLITIAQNGNGSISVVASGASSYQWQVFVAGGTWTNLSNGGNYSGVTTASLSINSATTALNNNRYRVVITPSASACSNVVSNECRLIVVSFAGYPTVVTTNVSQISAVGMTAGGNITSDGGNPIISRGIQYYPTSNPVPVDVISGSGSGTYISEVTGLNPSTQYSIRAFATNVLGTSYGNSVVFTTEAAPIVSISNVTICNSTNAVVPIYVQNFFNIGAVSLVIDFDPNAAMFMGYDSSALTGNLIVNSPPNSGRIFISWFSLSPVSSPYILLMNLHFSSNSMGTNISNTSLTFDSVNVGNCELADSRGAAIDATIFSNGFIFNTTGVTISQQPPTTLNVSPGISGSISVVANSASTYQWQVNTGNSWSNISNSQTYSGVNSNTLSINATLLMNNYQYRVNISPNSSVCPPVISNTCNLLVTP
jgi:hypothetical protein